MKLSKATDDAIFWLKNYRLLNFISSRNGVNKNNLSRKEKVHLGKLIEKKLIIFDGKKYSVNHREYWILQDKYKKIKWN